MPKKFSTYKCRQLVLFDEYWAEANKFAQGCLMSNSLCGGRILSVYLNKISSDIVKQQTTEPMPEVFIYFAEVNKREYGHHGGKQRQDIIEFIHKATAGTRESFQNSGINDYIVIEEKIDGRQQLHAYPLWSKLVYDERRPDGFYVKGNVELYKYLCDINGHETPFSLFCESEMCSFKTVNGYKLYRYLKPYEYKGQAVVAFDDLRKKLMLPKSYNKNPILWTQFLQPALEDINASEYCKVSICAKRYYDQGIGGRSNSYNALQIVFLDKEKKAVENSKNNADYPQKTLF